MSSFHLSIISDQPVLMHLRRQQSSEDPSIFELFTTSRDVYFSAKPQITVGSLNPDSAMLLSTYGTASQFCNSAIDQTRAGFHEILESCKEGGCECGDKFNVFYTSEYNLYISFISSPDCTSKLVTSTFSEK